MPDAAAIRALVEEEVARLLGLSEADRGDQGEIIVASGSSITHVYVSDGPTGTMVRLVSPLLRGVARSPSLFEKLNDLNSRTPYLRFFWKDDQVFCGTELAGDDLQWPEISNALTAITGQADHVDDLLRREFGGSTASAQPR